MVKYCDVCEKKIKLFDGWKYLVANNKIYLCGDCHWGHNNFWSHTYGIDSHPPFDQGHLCASLTNDWYKFFKQVFKIVRIENKTIEELGTEWKDKNGNVVDVKQFKKIHGKKPLTIFHWEEALSKIKNRRR